MLSHFQKVGLAVSIASFGALAYLHVDKYGATRGMLTFVATLAAIPICSWAFSAERRFWSLMVICGLGFVLLR
ncbi:hypothetical protein AGMMS49960_03660 [Betaproteobacteria bacterium]|nr:hypothetical protein AGMMS49543_02460 [Betaproteobacteria bacterium]GHT99141.1 hypothetical protein AGMMS49960_03660 [Betaproteobacteria bacterium]GHU13439.1 hypothetical protein AGMMS50225_23450 [Betaproteobacteria bacterium]